MERKSVSGRNWLVTIQAPVGSNDKWRCNLPDNWYEEARYMAQVYERGREATTCHTHILIAFKKTKRSNVLAKSLTICNKNSEIDVQLKRGSWEDAINYIMKQDNTKIDGRIPVERGERPREYNSKSVKKEEIGEIVETIKESGLNAVVEDHADYIMKYPSGCKLLKDLVAEKSKKRTVRVTIIWGDAGTGKTTWATQEGEKRWGKDDVYHFTKVGGSRDTIWFNNYSAQRCLIMDDITGRTMPFEYMLKILGNDPLDVEIKGGREAAMWEEVYITSNYDPMTWYSKIWSDNEESREAFFRRIHRIIHVFKEEGCSTWQVQKEEDVHIMSENFHITPNWENTPRWVREERRCEMERIGMRDEDYNANGPKEDLTPKSTEGLPDSTSELPHELPDTPGKGMYWGGADTFYLNYGPIKRGRIEEEGKKEMALRTFIKWKNAQLRGRGLEEITEEEMKAAIRDGRIKYNEKMWEFLVDKEDEIRRSHYISEEEWSQSEGYHDARHEEEVEDLYDITKNWEEDDSLNNHQWYEEDAIDEIF